MKTTGEGAIPAAHGAIAAPDQNGADIRPFGQLSDGREVSVITLTDGELRVRILTLGAILQDLRLAGVSWPLVLGSDLLAAYEGPVGWFGAVVGPVANRLRGARAPLNGAELQFVANNGAAVLHGGPVGTSGRIWTVEAASPAHVVLRLELADGTEGFPGNRVIRAEYRILPPDRLQLRLTAETDAPTLMNLAHHPYWALDGARGTETLTLQVAADHFLPVDDAILPTGEIRAVTGMRDLRQGRGMSDLPALDHNYCLMPGGPGAATTRTLTPAARLTGARGVSLEIATTAPGLQIYDGAHVNTAPFPGLMGTPYGPGAGVALEAQLWPDAPHHADFPSISMLPESSWEQVTEYRLTRVEAEGQIPRARTDPDQAE
ncbi:aldose epimerase family protein [Phaeovulum sp. W22_SRMD_FR3]|uniref:aldose epimerase family protein n=1 Tax=Phaeovulum sp. W22_SRMD_FR3 TaxID=3240274 RepID=UPI003F983C6D